MQKNKLIRLLQSLNKSELRNCRIYLLSNRKKKQKLLIKLFDRIRKYYPFYTSSKLLPEALFHHLFPDLQYDKVKLYKLVTALGSMVEDFIIWQHLSTDKTLYQHILREHYAKRNCYNELKKASQKRLEQLDANTIRDIHFYRERSLINHKLYFHQEAKPSQQSGEYLEELIHELDEFYWLSQLRYGCEILARKKALKQLYIPPFLATACQLLETSEFATKPLFRIYSNIIRLYDKGYCEALFQVTSHLFYKHRSLLNHEESYVVLQHLINILYGLSRRTGNLNISILYELHCFGIEQEIFVYSQKMTMTTFINIVATGAALQHFDKMRSFVDTHQQFLTESERNSVLPIASAYIYFYQGYWSLNSFHYSSALEILEETVTAVTQHEIMKRSLQIRIIYEADQQNLDTTYDIENLLENFSRFLRRKKEINSSVKNAYQNFIFLTKKLIKVPLYRAEEEINKLEVAIIDTDHLVLKFWLLKKVRELR